MSSSDREVFGPVRWMKDNLGYSTLETNKDLGGTDIVRYDAKSGQRTVLVSAKQLTPNGQSKSLNIDNYIWSEDDSKLLIFTNTKKVWRYNTKGDYWVLDLKTGNLQKLGKSIERSTMMFARFSIKMFKLLT